MGFAVSFTLNLSHLATWLSDQQLIGNGAINAARLSGVQSDPAYRIERGPQPPIVNSARLTHSRNQAWRESVSGGIVGRSVA